VLDEAEVVRELVKELDLDELELVKSEEELDVEERTLDDELLVAELLLEPVELLDETLDEDELLEVDVILDDVELLVAVEDVLEDELEVELNVSGTPPGPAMICRIFSVAELNTVGAREIWLLSRS
jgi:hypothetical protein